MVGKLVKMLQQNGKLVLLKKLYSEKEILFMIFMSHTLSMACTEFYYYYYEHLFIFKKQKNWITNSCYP